MTKYYEEVNYDVINTIIGLLNEYGGQIFIGINPDEKKTYNLSIGESIDKLYWMLGKINPHPYRYVKISFIGNVLIIDVLNGLKKYEIID